MTENEIISALEVFLKAIRISGEQYIDISAETLAGTLNLIYNLKAKKEGLIAGQESLQKALAAKIAESEKQSQKFKVLVSDHKTLQQSFDNLKGLYEEQKARVKKAKEKSIYFAKELQKAKAEIERLNKAGEKDFEAIAVSTVDRHQKWIKRRAIKEFAERLKDNFPYKNACYTFEGIEYRINNLVKEMVGDTE